MQWSIGAARKTKHWQLRIIPSPRKESLHNHSRGVFWKLLHKLASWWTEALRLKGDWECLNLTNVPTEERSWMIMKEHRGIERWQKECKKYADWMARGTGGPLACLRHRLSPYLGPKFSEDESWRQMRYRVNIKWSTWHYSVSPSHDQAIFSFIHIRKRVTFFAQRHVSTCLIWWQNSRTLKV